MKKSIKAVVMFSVIAFSAVTFANPKCAHRMASGKNDLFKNTNPVKERVAKTAKVSSGTSSSRSGVK